MFCEDPCSLYRHRSQNFPPVPNSLQGFAEILQQPQWSELGRSISEDGEAYPFFRGIIGPGDEQGRSAAVYLSARLQDTLSNSRLILMGATFKVLPLQLGTLLHFITVHAEYLNYVSKSSFNDSLLMTRWCFQLFPVAFEIITRKTHQAYEGVLQYLMQLVPQWQPEIVLAGFETAIRNAAHLIWPRARISGMLFPLRPGNFPHAFYSATAALNSSQSRGWQGIVHDHSCLFLLQRGYRLGYVS
ncbi:hypothetical protein J6590_048541 [Homalodisca vitripennis]|nr:hypothetical protein J6590_048541 [Homalodisca vitripennis]